MSVHDNMQTSQPLLLRRTAGLQITPVRFQSQIKATPDHPHRPDHQSTPDHPDHRTLLRFIFLMSPSSCPRVSSAIDRSFLVSAAFFLTLLSRRDSSDSSLLWGRGVKLKV